MGYSAVPLPLSATLESGVMIVVPCGVVFDFTEMQSETRQREDSPQGYSEVTRLGDPSKMWMCVACGQITATPQLHTCAIIGPATRLARTCLFCGDELPACAVYCIQCGARV